MPIPAPTMPLPGPTTPAKPSTPITQPAPLLPLPQPRETALALSDLHHVTRKLYEGDAQELALYPFPPTLLLLTPKPVTAKRIRASQNTADYRVGAWEVRLWKN